MARMSARDQVKAATFDSAARGRMGQKGMAKSDKETKPMANKDAASIPSKGTKATGSGMSKGDPRPKPADNKPRIGKKYR